MLPKGPPPLVLSPSPHWINSNPSYGDICFPGCGQWGDEIHIWWSCTSLVGFWLSVFGLLFTLFYIPICRKNAELALLHCPILLSAAAATYLFIATKCAIARAWKKNTVLFAEVKSIPMTMVVNEKLTSILHDSHPKFLKVRAPWWSYTITTLHPTSFGIPG